MLNLFSDLFETEVMPVTSCEGTAIETCVLCDQGCLITCSAACESISDGGSDGCKTCMLYCRAVCNYSCSLSCSSESFAK